MSLLTRCTLTRVPAGARAPIIIICSSTREAMRKAAAEFGQTSGRQRPARQECSEFRREARTVQQRANQVTPPDHFVKMPKRPSDTTVQVASAPASSMTSSRLKIRIKRFHAVSRWSWNVNDEVCGICQTAFEGTSPNVKYPGEDCPVVFGKCGHAFHLQCVSQWLSTSQANNKQQSCPICRAEWVFGENPVSRESV